MTNKESERQAEIALITSLRYRNLLAWHMNTTIDGFPDVIVVGKRIALVEVKCRKRKASVTLDKIMEPSQPVFMARLGDVEFPYSYLLVFDDYGCRLYYTSMMLQYAMDGRPYWDLPIAYDGENAIDVADYLVKVCNG